MSHTDRIIIETYSGLSERLSSLNKIGLIESLSKSLKAELNSKEKAFYKSFGAFSTEKSVEENCSEIKTNRKFRNKV